MPTLAPELRLVQLRTGDLDPATGEPPVGGVTGIVAANIGALWGYYADVAAIAPRLQSLYVERDCYKMLLGVVQDEVNISLGQGSDSQSLSDRARALQKRHDATVEEIKRIEARASANRAGVLAPITKVTPVPLPLPGDVANPQSADDPTWSGSPYWPGSSTGPLRDGQIW